MNEKALNQHPDGAKNQGMPAQPENKLEKTCQIHITDSIVGQRGSNITQSRGDDVA